MPEIISTTVTARALFSSNSGGDMNPEFGPISWRTWPIAAPLSSRDRDSKISAFSGTSWVIQRRGRRTGAESRHVTQKGDACAVADVLG